MPAFSKAQAQSLHAKVKVFKERTFDLFSAQFCGLVSLEWILLLLLLLFII